MFKISSKYLDVVLNAAMIIEQMLVQYKLFVARSDASRFTATIHILLARAVSPELEAMLS